MKKAKLYPQLLPPAAVGFFSYVSMLTRAACDGAIIFHLPSLRNMCESPILVSHHCLISDQMAGVAAVGFPCSLIDVDAVKNKAWDMVW